MHTRLGLVYHRLLELHVLGLWCRHYYSAATLTEADLPTDTFNLDDLIAEAIEYAWVSSEPRAPVGNLLSALPFHVGVDYRAVP